MPPAPGPTSVIACTACGIHRHGIGHAHHLRDGGILRDHRRVYALLDALAGVDRDAEQLHAVAKLIRPAQVFRRDRGNALNIDGARIDLDAEREAGEDRELLRGVMALDVEARIRLRIPKPLRVFQAIRKRQALLLHAGQDVIAGPVQDAVDARELVADETLAQRLDDRDTAGDRRLEVERDVDCARRAPRASRRARRAAPCWRSPPICRPRAPSRRHAWPDRPHRRSIRQTRRCRDRARAQSGPLPSGFSSDRRRGSWPDCAP